MRHVGPRGRVAVARAVDEQLPAYGLAAGLGLYDHGLDLVSTHRGADGPGVQQQPDIGLLDHLEADELEHLGVAHGVLHLDPFRGPHRVAGLEPIEELDRQAGHENLTAFAIADEDDHQTAGGEPAQATVSLDHEHVRSHPSRGHRGRHTCRPAAKHDDVSAVNNGDVPSRLVDVFGHGSCLQGRDCSLVPMSTESHRHGGQSLAVNSDG